MTAACLALLVLLPGLLAVRAPWTAVPALSLAFWAVSAWWLPAAAGSRERFLWVALIAAGGLALLRLLPKHEVPPPPGWPAAAPLPPARRPGGVPPALTRASSLCVAAVALAAPLCATGARHAPGPALAFATTSARLVVWRDGPPLSLEPLLPLGPFGAHAPALATLGADLALSSREDAAPAVLLVVLTAAGLSLVGLFALLATRSAPLAAACGALLAFSVLPWLRGLDVWGAGAGFLALGFVLPAAALLHGHASRSSACAAGLLVAAGLLSQPLLAATVFAATLVVAARRDGAAAAARRCGLALALAAVFAAPGLSQLLRALSREEAVAVFASVRGEQVLAFALAASLALFGPPLGARLARGRRGRAALVALALVGAGSSLAGLRSWVAAGQLPPATLAALERAARATGPFDAVCAAPSARDWLPALVARRAGEALPWVPLVYRDERAAALPPRCAAALR